MRNPLVLLTCLITATTFAAPCDRSETSGFEPSPHTIQYASVKKNPGEIFVVGGRQYVMRRHPFTEFSTNAHYAVTAPVEIEMASSVTAFAGIITVHKTGDYCSDVAVVGRSNPVHKLPIHESRYTTSYVSTTENTTQFSGHRSVIANLTAQIGATHLSFGLSINSVDYRTELNRVDHDLTNDINWTTQTHWPYPAIYELNQLIDYIYITKL